ncbi:A/G-specific adenine glycosylase [Collibacillus ludicampi]|jgi:A/G-specific adenine glycosylase|uniref:Adenine DNA glycosylase n=1 Tax=Collibacillus ludicampi TaxID=2771369 RepID=A0AAV4LGG2_9BACL|nr:A/G-specific adenine glycosylase [Collibacillus ludicampi]GIM46803.1 A/G-specific adenine glycosylase [Collibacillus ludicampi]
MKKRLAANTKIADVSYQEAALIGQRLLTWYEEKKRDLPWRRTRDPYKIWVSEVMLQQTRVETVIPYWERFIDKFPTIQALAHAPEEEVLKAWEGLGYYSRARNLQAAVREVEERYGGQVPDTLEEISSLPGVGSYTAGAVLSIAYDVDVPAVDGNVLRVLARLFLIEQDIMKQRVRKRFEELAEFLIPPGRAASFNQALMELGATVCIPKVPRCPQCPLQSLCRAYAEGMQEELPVKGKKKPPRPVDLVTGIVRSGDRVLIVKRPLQGLLAGMWEFPSLEINERVTIEENLQSLFDRLGQRIEVETFFAKVEHTFSHIHWNLHAYLCKPILPLVPETEEMRWVNVYELHQYAFPVAHTKLIQALNGMV